MQFEEMRVVAAVAQHWLVGSIPLNGSRLQDVLKDESSDFVRLTSVEVYGDANRQSCIATLPHALVPKAQLELVILPEERHEAPVKRWNNFTARAPAHVFAIVSDYCIQGELQLPTSTLDSLHALTHQLGTFFPVREASVLGPGTNQTSAPVLFVNKRFLSCFHVGEAAAVNSAAAELASSPQ